MILSHSSISLYRECPLRYRFIEVEKRKREPKSYFSFGGTIHRTLQSFYADSLLDAPTLRELLLFYRKVWIHQGYQDEEEKEYYRLGLSILANFHKKASEEKARPVALEYHFLERLNNLSIRGVVDRIDKTDDGLEIIDYKTSKFLPGVDRLKDDRQLAIYQIGVERHLAIPVCKLSIYHLRSMTKISIPAHDSSFLDRIKTEIEEVADRIEHADFEPNLHDSCPCEFDHLCPYFREKYEEVDIAGVINDYGELKESIKEKQKQIEDLGQKIIEHLNQHNLDQAFGDKFSVYRRLVKESDFKKKFWKIIDEKNLRDEIIAWLKEKGYSVREKETTKTRLYLRRNDV